MFPSTANMLFDHFEGLAQRSNLSRIAFEVSGLPLSLNHQYQTSVRYRKDESGKKKGYVRKNLKPEVEDYRWIVKAAVSRLGEKWKPTGVTAAIILFESPIWLTKAHFPRQKDADNLVKPVLDATEKATNVADELHWEFHVYKMASGRERTVVYLFDLGPVVEYYL